LARLALIVVVLHTACRVVSRGSGRLKDLFALWGYTQIPGILLLGLAGIFFAAAPVAFWSEVGIWWVLLIGGSILFLSLWGLILKLQALKVCYGMDGKRLLAAVGLALVLAGCLAWLERLFLFERGLVPYASLQAMEPSHAPVIAVRKNLSLPLDTMTYWFRPPRRGEIVGFTPPKADDAVVPMLGFRARWLGRIVGLPGETIEVRQGRLWINHQATFEPYLKGSPGIDFPSTTLQLGAFFILADDRSVPVVAYGGGVVPQHAIRGRLTDVGHLKWRLVLGEWPW
jgi:signal peptidase I